MQRVYYVNYWKSICCPGSVQTGSLTSSVDGQWHFKILREIMQAVHVIQLLSIYFLIPDHLKNLLSASIFVKPGWLKCSASITCHFSSSGVTILSPANKNSRRSLTSQKTWTFFLGPRSFWLLPASYFQYFLSSNYFLEAKPCKATALSSCSLTSMLRFFLIPL